MSSPTSPPADSFMNSPLVNTITGYIVHLQQQNVFSKENVQSLKQCLLITVGFLVLLYCLIHIQMLFFWLLKLIFRLIFKIFSLIFWLPLRTARFFIPKSIDYDILFPIFWLCSISSFYISKFSHENICQFYDQYLVRHYKIFNYDQSKREDIRRYLFIITFVILLLLQTLFILIPIASTIRHQHENVKVSSQIPIAVTQTTTVKTTTTKSPINDAVETMSGNLYNRFIDAFTDDNEISRNEKRSPLISDEKLEDTFKTIQKTLKDGMHNLKSTDKEKKSSRFQRWIIHYLKAPFQKWESKRMEEVHSHSEEQNDEEEEENIDSNSSSSIPDENESDTEDESDQDEDDPLETDDDDDDDDEDHTAITERIKQRLSDVKEQLKENKIFSSNQNEDDDDEDSDDSDDEENDDSPSLKESLTKPIETVKKLSSSTDSDEEDLEDESDDEDEPTTTITDKISEQAAKSVEKVKTIAETIAAQVQEKDDSEESGYESDDEEDENEQSSELTEKIKETLADPIKNVQNVATDIENQIMTDDDDDEEETSSTITGDIKEKLAKAVETVEDLGEKVIDNVKTKFSSSEDIDEEEAVDVESDEEEEAEHPSILDRVQENVIEPIEKAATNLRDKLPSLEKHVEDLSILERTKQSAEKLLTPIKDRVVSNAEMLKHKASDLVDSAEEMASNVVKKSSKYLKDKTKQIKNRLPKKDKIISKIKRQVIKPIETKVAKVKKDLKTKTKQLKEAVINKIPFRKPKKPKTLTEKIKDQFESITHSFQEKFAAQKKKRAKIAKIPKLKSAKKLNGVFDDAWNIWHLAKRKLAHIFISSTKHARHLPRYNTTSLYTAYTDIKCNDYTKKLFRQRLFKGKYAYFLDTYRSHSPFPVYLSILKSNGPKCYRQYPNSTCPVESKSLNRNWKTQLYRFVRFWAMIGLIIVILSFIYKRFVQRKPTNPSTFRRRPEAPDQSSNKTQQTTVSSKNDLSRSIQQTTSVDQNKTSSTINTSPLNEQVERELRLWLQREQNDGFRQISETCRTAINNTFLKQLERLSVETLQFANAKIRHVSQNNNKTGETTPEKIVINAVLDIDHLILNIVNTFKEQHFSLETQKLSGQLYILLVINPNQYAIEAALQQLQINPANVIDPNNVLSTDDKQTIIKLIDETINRTTVRCTFRLSDNQENTTLYNSSAVSPSTTIKTYSTPKQLTTSTIQTTASRSPVSSVSRSPQPSLTRYQPTESIPTVLINDTNQHLYSNTSSLQQEPKKILVRIVKAVKLHDVEQPYCILELNHPKQIQQTSIAKNGLNPFWDERFLFECNDQSDQIHLQIVDRKTSVKRSGNNYVDTVYADVLIPFSYVTTTLYKQDVQLSPQYPESIIRIEFSTLSEEDALAANNGYDVESLTDSQTWTYNDRETNKIQHDYPQRFQQSSSNDYLSSSYDAGAVPSHYGLSTSLYNDNRDYGATIPRPTGSNSSPFSSSIPRDGGLLSDKPQKSKSFMSSLKHLTLPRRKHHHKNKYDTNMGSHASSITQLNTSLPLPSSNLAAHSLSSALPGPHPEYFLTDTADAKPIRRSRSISQSFKNLFRSNSKKKANSARADALGEYENGTHNYILDDRNYLSTSSAPTSKKLSFLQRRKSKQKAKQQTDFSTNSLSSYDCSRMESIRDTPIRANVGHPVTMTKSSVR